jgi:hypothetical protein
VIVEGYETLVPYGDRLLPARRRRGDFQPEHLHHLTAE